MFEALTGELPVEGRSTEAILQALLYAEPRRLRQLRPKAPRDLDAVLHKLLHKDPEDRYADGETLARDLLRVADDEPVRIRRLPNLLRLWRLLRKHRGLASAITVAVVLLGVVFWQQRRASQSRYQNLLLQAAGLVEGEAGDPAGPEGFLAALTGIPTEARGGSAGVLGLLAEAARLQPDEERPGKLRVAYLDDPAPEATSALARGEGLSAWRIFDRRITELERLSGFASRDAVTWFELYRLYLGRAVAAVTAPVARPEAASRDLVRATSVRPGAFFPAMLAAVLDWSPAAGLGALDGALARVLESAPPGAREAAGALLVATAGLVRSEDASMMELPMSFEVRRGLHSRGVEMLGTTPRGARGLHLGPLDAALGAAAASARENLAATDLRDAALARGRSLLAQHTTPTSPLRSWEVVYDLLAQPQTVAEVLASPQRALSTRLRALEQWLALDPSGEAFRAGLVGVAEWLDGLPRDDALVCRVVTMLGDRLGDRQRARAGAEAWVQSDSRDPEAYFWRFCCGVRAGDEAVAADCVVACQRAADPEAMRGRIVRELQRAAAAAPDDVTKARWEGLQAQFAGGE
jgi:hypothetical protein